MARSDNIDFHHEGSKTRRAQIRSEGEIGREMRWTGVATKMKKAGRTARYFDRISTAETGRREGNIEIRNILAICGKNRKPPLAGADLYWIPAFAGMTTGCCTWLKCYRNTKHEIRNKCQCVSNGVGEMFFVCGVRGSCWWRRQASARPVTCISIGQGHVGLELGGVECICRWRWCVGKAISRNCRRRSAFRRWRRVDRSRLEQVACNRRGISAIYPYRRGMLSGPLRRRRDVVRFCQVRRLSGAATWSNCIFRSSTCPSVVLAAVAA